MTEENQSGFKVTDRRLFNTDGTVREDVQIEEEVPTITATPEPQPAANALSSAQTHAASPEAFPTEAPPPLQPEAFQDQEDDQNDMHEQTMFTEFLMNIASTAFIYLGLVEHPGTGRRQVDMMAAKETIDVLVMLHEKTKGNLTRGEARFFDDLLADLKTQFVSMRR